MAASKHLLFVPGLGCTGELYSSQIAALRRRVEITVADHTRHETMAELASSILAEAPKSFAICGLSMGGYIAMEILRQAPERVERVALIDTMAGLDSEPVKARRRKLIGLAESGRFAEVFPILWPLMVHPDAQSDAELRATTLKMLEDIGPEAFVRQQKAILNRPDSRPTLAGITCPTLILVGDQDVMTPVSESREMAARIKGAELVILPMCGHMSMMERATEVTMAMADWLARG